jgi:hypothetical protein
VTVFLANGVLSWRDANRFFSHRTTKILHASLNAIGAGLIGLGLYVTIKAHSSPHFMSLHSWMALAAVAMLGMQILAGIGFFALPIFPLATRARVVPLHAWLGIVAFFTLIGVVLSGLIQYNAFRSSGDRSYNSTQTNIVSDILGGLILIGALLTAWALIDRRQMSLDASAADRTTGRYGTRYDEGTRAKGPYETRTPVSRASTTAAETPRYTQATTNPFGAEPVPVRRNVTPPATAPPVHHERAEAF